MVETWSAHDVEAVRAALAADRGRAGEPRRLPASPRGVLADGRADFRGFPLTEMTGVAIADADLSAARAPKNPFGVEQAIVLRTVVAERSVFDRAGKFRQLDGRFSACSFRRITTQSCSVAGQFTDCDFTGANFSGAHLAARFARCRFEGCNLHLASWPSSFQDCAFAGARIHELFADVRAAAFAAERVTFTVTTSRVLAGEFR